MLYKRRRANSAEPGGYFHLESQPSHRKVFGYGDGGQIKLQDQSGVEWRGSAERGDDQSVYYRFRNSEGAVISGMGHGNQIMLRDSKGRVWKGFVD
jgi:hypothetical protein